MKRAHEKHASSKDVGDLFIDTKVKKVTGHIVGKRGMALIAIK